jgi:lysophospholipase L1-like esterase
MRFRKRLTLLVVIGLVLVACAGAYIEFHFDLRPGSGPAGPPVPLEPFQKEWSDRKILLLGVGDSVTAGFGARRGYSYFDRLAVNPADEFSDMHGRCLTRVLPNLVSQNIAVSGSNSLDHVRHIREKLAAQPADTFGLVVMTSGGNDLIHWYGRSPPKEGAMYGATRSMAQPWIANYEGRLDELFGLIRERFPGGCLIFIADIYDPSDGRGDPESAWLPAWPDVSEIHAAYNAAIVRAAQRHPNVHVVPMHQEFLGHGIHCRKFWHSNYRSADPYYWYAPNLEDPNERGYDAIRRVFLKSILECGDASPLSIPSISR